MKKINYNKESEQRQSLEPCREQMITSGNLSVQKNHKQGGVPGHSTLVLLTKPEAVI